MLKQPMTESHVPRRVLAQHLRELRQQAGLTVKLAARLMEWSEPKLWRIETGQTALRAWMCRPCARLMRGAGVTGRCWAGGQTRAQGWWRAYGEAIPDDFNIYAAWRMPPADSRCTRRARYRACCGPKPMPAPSSRAPASRRGG